MKKLGGLGKVGKDLAKEGVSQVLNTVVQEIIDETNIKEIAKEQIMDAGKKIMKDDSIPTKDKMQKEILKMLIKKQLGI
ncbi:MAG: hypothetical protein ACFFD4_36035 [Candidatus Odinarchaeota archaeon]